jgi:hypothetical protein
MKQKMITLLVFIASLSTQAQLKLFDKKDPSTFHKAVQVIISDFPYNYKHITGELVDKQGDFEQYASTVRLPGAQSCVIGYYHSSLDTTASWQALMLSTEEFKEAAQEYKRLYHELKSCKMKTADGSAYYMAGTYEAPAEETDFVTSTLVIETGDERFLEFKIEVELLYQLDKWIVNVNMVSKKKDDEVTPDWMK